MALEALFVFLAAAVPAQAVESIPQDPVPPPTPAAAASPSPPPAFRLLPYWYESPRTPSTAPLLRFEDHAEVRSLEMNAAIARFFDKDGNGDMRRGATPGGAPSLAEMKSYRPHVSPSIDFLSLAMWAANLGRGAVSRRYKSRVERNEETLRALLLGEHPTPSPSPSPTPGPSPSPDPALPTPTPPAGSV